MQGMQRRRVHEREHGAVAVDEAEHAVRVDEVEIVVAAGALNTSATKGSCRRKGVSNANGLCKSEEEVVWGEMKSTDYLAVGSVRNCP